MVEVQALCRRQQEQDSVCDLWAEMRRSYADVAKQAVDLSPKKKERTGKQGNTVREHLEEVASKLAAWLQERTLTNLWMCRRTS